jgi:enoyl-CoA hydratase
LPAALALARQLSSFPQTAMRQDRLSAIEQWDLGWQEAIDNEIAHGETTVASGEMALGARTFSQGAGRHGKSV